LQMLRRQCYESIGGWVAMPYGGQDWVALVTAQMRGWRIKAFRDLPVFHHRPTGGAERRYRNIIREGRMDSGIHLVYQHRTKKCSPKALSSEPLERGLTEDRIEPHGAGRCRQDS
jgi:hypothetical protein